MKIMPLKNYLTALLFSLSLGACVEDSDFSVPESLGTEENEVLNEILKQIDTGAIQLVSISEVKSMYKSFWKRPFQVDTDIIVKAYVTSSDQSGNFYKELYLQDSPEAPTSGIKLILNLSDSYNRFNKGREVYIRLNPPTPTNYPNGLYIGEERLGNKVITIGGGTETKQYGTTVTSLSENQINTSVFRSEKTYKITPLVVQISQLSKDHIGLFVQIENAEFEENLNGERYFNPSENYDTSRTIQTCSGTTYSTFDLETSSFSSFKNELLPTGNGTVAGIISKTYDGSRLVLALNTTDDVNMNDLRCSL